MTEENGKENTQEQKQDVLNVADLMEAVKQELAEEDMKAKEAQNKKIEELKENTLSKDKVKDIMKAMLREQQEATSATQQTKEELESSMDELQKKLDEMSGSKTQTQVEDDAFKSVKNSQDKDEEVELTDKWVLEQKGII